MLLATLIARGSGQAADEETAGPQQASMLRAVAERSENKTGSLGDDLLSQGVSPQVPSALEGLTAGFGMGPGVPPPLQSPKEPVFSLSIVAYGLLHMAYSVWHMRHRLYAISHSVVP